MASPRPRPFDDDDRPSGSVQPLSLADLQAILAHLGEGPDQLLAGTGADRPVVAMRVRASVGQPGGSAHAQWRRLRAAEWAIWTRTLLWRAAATLGIAVGGESLAAWWCRGSAWWLACSRPWRPAGGCGSGPAPTPFVVDSKQYRGRLQLDPSGRLWHGRYPLTAVLRTASFEADRAAQILADPQVVVPIVAVHGAQIPWGKVVVEGVPVVSARRLPSMLRTLPAVLGPSGSPP
jgi:hypothetical protein